MIRCFHALAIVVAILFGQTTVVLAAGADRPVRIAAASSLQFVLNEIIAGYEEQAGNVAPKVVYGSSGNLFRQIVQGAPFDVFLSADSALITKLQNENKTHSLPTVFGTDQLVLYTTGEQAASIEDIRQLLVDGSDTRFKIAIANPRHAPFGRAAQQALESLALWNPVQSHLVFAERVSQAAQFAVSGATQYAIISRSLALSRVLSEAGSFTLIDPHHYQRIDQSMVLTTCAEEAQSVYDFLRDSSVAIDALKRFGLR